MQKSMKIMLICTGILFGSIFIYKFFMGLMFKHYMASQSQAVTVSAIKAEYTFWQPQITAAASLRAVQGVTVSTQVPGIVQHIYFKPGAVVQEGTELIMLDADDDIAHLHSLEATSELARITLDRDKKLSARGALSKAQFDADEATLKSAEAQVIEQVAVVNKKIIRAPFSGRLGISAVNPGQYLNPGDKIVTLQALDSVYADFSVPQQILTQLKNNMPVELTIEISTPDTNTPDVSKQIFTGKITTIDPVIDTNTRNGQVEAIINNLQHKLVPGMFASITINTGQSVQYLTLPQTAISYNPYGNIVYVIKKSDKNKNLIALQTFVKTGPTRGDQIAILEGLKAGEKVVASGQSKLKNNTAVIINNTVMPNNNPLPQAIDE